MTLTFHILCNPYVPSLATNTADAFNQFARRFSKMMTNRGHKTIFYGTSQDNSLVCSEYLSCLSMKDYREVYGKGNDYNSSKQLVISDWDDDMAKKGNTILCWYIDSVSQYLKEKGNSEKDLIMHFYNWATYSNLRDTFKDWKHIDAMIMSNSGCAPYRIYCSNHSLTYDQAFGVGQMHTARNFKIKDKVSSEEYPSLGTRMIYPFFNPNDFTSYPKKKTGAILFCSRISKYKGIQYVFALAKVFPEKQFWLCGNPHPSESGFNLDDYPNVKYFGFASIKLRKKLLSEASVLIQPVQYEEPLNFSVIEAYLSSLPVITSDRGAFKETVLQGITGFRCHDMADYISAIKRIDEIKPENCRKWAVENFTEEKCYQGYMNAFRSWFPNITEWKEGEFKDDLERQIMCYPIN